MTLATICDNALRELSGFERPSTWFASTNLTAVNCVALANLEGRSLIRRHRLTSLITTGLISTVPGTASYALPSDFHAFAYMSHWDRTNSRRMMGPTGAATWQWLKGDIGAGATIDRWFRQQGGLLYIHPTPTETGDTIAFDYYSKNWIQKQSDSTTTDAWSSDLDTSLIDELVISLGLKWRFLQAKGMPYEPEYREYERVLEEYLSDDGGKGSIRFGGPSRVETGLPDRGFGL